MRAPMNAEAASGEQSPREWRRRRREQDRELASDVEAEVHAADLPGWRVPPTPSSSEQERLELIDAEVARAALARRVLMETGAPSALAPAFAALQSAAAEPPQLLASPLHWLGLEQPGAQSGFALPGLPLGPPPGCSGDGEEPGQHQWLQPWERADAEAGADLVSLAAALADDAAARRPVLWASATPDAPPAHPVCAPPAYRDMRLGQPEEQFQPGWDGASWRGAEDSSWQAFEPEPDLSTLAGRVAASVSHAGRGRHEGHLPEPARPASQLLGSGSWANADAETFRPEDGSARAGPDEGAELAPEQPGAAGEEGSKGKSKGKGKGKEKGRGKGRARENRNLIAQIGDSPAQPGPVRHHALLAVDTLISELWEIRRPAERVPRAQVDVVDQWADVRGAGKGEAGARGKHSGSRPGWLCTITFQSLVASDTQQEHKVVSAAPWRATEAKEAASRLECEILERDLAEAQRARQIDSEPQPTTDEEVQEREPILAWYRRAFDQLVIRRDMQCAPVPGSQNRSQRLGWMSGIKELYASVGQCPGAILQWLLVHECPPFLEADRGGFGGTLGQLVVGISEDAHSAWRRGTPGARHAVMDGWVQKCVSAVMRRHDAARARAEEERKAIERQSEEISSLPVVFDGLPEKSFDAVPEWFLDAPALFRATDPVSCEGRTEAQLRAACLGEDAAPPGSAPESGEEVYICVAENSNEQADSPAGDPPVACFVCQRALHRSRLAAAEFVVGVRIARRQLAGLLLPAIVGVYAELADAIADSLRRLSTHSCASASGIWRPDSGSLRAVGEGDGRVNLADLSSFGSRQGTLGCWQATRGCVTPLHEQARNPFKGCTPERVSARALDLLRGRQRAGILALLRRYRLPTLGSLALSRWAAGAQVLLHWLEQFPGVTAHDDLTPSTLREWLFCEEPNAEELPEDWWGPLRQNLHRIWAVKD
ncbi:unnamed protein product [Prorocentrum cordatum]|uniref:Uncharacterized protein n=1 Tax=Prorocentrum cordatum TaxID=2364126 RepID=A0ABN9XGK4_9DINO|nr:unnamed protein product [Polarella glacialis]